MCKSPYDYYDTIVLIRNNPYYMKFIHYLIENREYDKAKALLKEYRS